MVDLSKASVTPEEMMYSLKKEMHLKGICQKVLYQRVINKAAQERGITVSPEDVQAQADEIRYANRLEKAAETLAWLADQMVTAEDWEAGISDRLLAQKLAESLFSKHVEKSFAQNRLDFEQVLVYQILVDSEEIAQELFYQIEEGEISFYEAAHFYDIDPERQRRCGYEGKLPRWSFKPEIAAVIFSVQPGEVTHPLHTEQGYHLFLVEEFIRAELTEEKSKEILQGMFQEWLNTEVNYMIHSEISTINTGE
ncbi:peptidylprolyl isomerase [Moorena producens PAL-8-15-08-1]|uniref:peptidylprolyl isomerase n=1 Tax=Moorena producens PAL-8-15-08-1 TaxID=1458985 RepID=A0A1D8TKE1_9CYAN|nr:peptidylprolyl isomerase [Moorena producens]AOW98108.1 peptidylprolyl isomerase [Moorena producens PAL-8-15-08-1]